MANGKLFSNTTQNSFILGQVKFVHWTKFGKIRDFVRKIKLVFTHAEESRPNIRHADYSDAAFVFLNIIDSTQ